MSKRKTPPKVITNHLGYNLRNLEDKKPNGDTIGVWGHNTLKFTARNIDEAKKLIDLDYQDKKAKAVAAAKKATRKIEKAHNDNLPKPKLSGKKGLKSILKK